MTEFSAQGGDRAADEASANGHHSADDLLASLPADFGKATVNGHTAASPTVDEGMTDVNGLRPGDEGYLPFNRPSLTAKYAESKQYGSQAAVTVVGGLYAAEHAVARGKFPRGKGGYDAVAALSSILVTDAKAVGLIDHTPSEADVARWYDERGQAWEPSEATVRRSELKVATKGLDPTRKIALATLDAHANGGEPWAVEVIDTARAENAYAAVMGDRKRRPVSLTAAQLWERGVPPEAIVALPGATPLTLGESARIVRAWDAEDRLRATEHARAIEAAKAVAAIEIPRRIDLATYTPPDTAWLVEELMPMHGSLGLFAERKAGKTTTVVELVRAVLAGGGFLGRFATHLPAGARVALLDTEMTPAMLLHEYTKVGTDADSLSRIDLHPLRGRSRLLDLRDETTRARWRELIAPESVIVVDCLYTVLAAAQVDESSAQVSDIIDGIKALAVECAAAGLVIVHHLGKDPTKGARGHSSIEGSVDTLATIRLDGPPAADTPRLFSATGRLDVDVPAALLTRGEDNRLSLSSSSPKADKAKALAHRDDDITWSLISNHPGLSVRSLELLPEETRKLSRSSLRRSHTRLASLGYVINKGSERRPEWHAADRNGDPWTNPAD